MKYLLLMYANEAEATAVSAEAQREWMDFPKAVLKAAQDSGAVLDTGGVAPTSHATTVRVRNGKTLITDGPFAETHEQLAGYFLFECKDLDEAIQWATKIPTAKYGSIEIRPLWSPQQ